MSDQRTHAIAVFVKTPGLSPIKTRLAADIGRSLAERFYFLSIAAIRETLLTVQKASDLTQAFWAVAEDEKASKFWSDFDVLFQRGNSLGERLYSIHSSLKQRFDIVTLIGADAPQLASTQLLELPSRIPRDSSQVVVGPAADGGFYLFSSNFEISKDIWMNVEYSASSTLEELLAAVGTRATHSKLERLTDVDSKRDLLPLLAELSVHEHASQAQKDLGAWISTLNKTVRTS